MGFGFRKSLTSGPFRITVSKLGLSMSLGAGGARVTAGPRGTHVSFSKAGFYYRTRLDAPPRREKNAQHPEVQPTPVEFPDPTIVPTNTSGPAPPNEIFGDTTPDEVVREMNDRIKRRNYAIPIAVVVSAALAALSAPWQIVAVDARPDSSSRRVTLISRLSGTEVPSHRLDPSQRLRFPHTR
jgi:hypothetical protein